jgi:hypothetical protein
MTTYKYGTQKQEKQQQLKSAGRGEGGGYV